MSRSGRPLPVPERAREAVAEALAKLSENEREQAVQALSRMGARRMERTPAPAPRTPLPTETEASRVSVSASIEWV